LKKKQLRYTERNREERIKYYQKLRNFIKKFGSKSLVFIDESEFIVISNKSGTLFLVKLML
jgi:hypothetical protein